MRLKSLLALGSLLLAASSPASAGTHLLRFPDLHGEQVVFTHAGDLWLASAEGGEARRLTSHPGLELFAKFSPDGQHVAFTGQYDGDEQVYVVPVTGGSPRQLTFYPALGPLPPRWGYDNQVYGWSPGGDSVLFRSARDGFDLTDTRLYEVAVDGGMPEPLPMPVSGAGDYSPDGRQVVYSPLFRDFRHWKRYEGGWAQDLWTFDLEARTASQLTEHVRSERDPMWIGDRIVFASDRSDTLNLWSVAPDGSDLRQLTRSTDWDVRWPSADPSNGRIVYELGGELQIYDLAAGTDVRLDIHVPDDGVPSRPRRISVAEQIRDAQLSPEGKRALFSARGEIFTAPIEHGPTRNLTRSSGAHDRMPAWSPDGSRIAFVSDRDGEEEIWLVAQDGSGPPRQLTDGNTGRIYDLGWSPDGEHIAFRDAASRLRLAAVTEEGLGEIIDVADDPSPFGLSYSWAPDSGSLAFSLAEPNGQRSLYLWTVGSAEPRRITGELWNEYAPEFSPDGQYLYFLSDREFAPQIGSFEFNYVVDRETGIYALALQKDAPHPFPPRSDEIAVDEAEKEESDEASEEDGEKEEEKEKKVKVTIDFEGLEERVARVPLPADNYLAVVPLEKHLLVAKTGAPYYGRASDQPTDALLLDLEKRSAEPLVSDVSTLALSFDRKKALVGNGGGFQLYEIGGGSPKAVSTAGLEVDWIPREEWAQIFDEAWRRFRDFFYAENMHGYDWAALREQYRPLLAHVGHRSDLNDVIAEMIAELNTSHTYVAGGDLGLPDRPRSALLGARFEADGERFRISEIFPGHNAEEGYRSPLTEVGVGVSVGDYVLAIQGQELTTDDNPFRLLRHAGGGPVELRVSASRDGDSARTVLVHPLQSEDSLLYLRWVEGNRKAVHDATDGKVGYLHLPDMGSAGIREWIKWYYGQVRKQGLVIDVRSNGGGNVSQMVIERLRRDLLMVDFERHSDLADTYPNVVFHGHLVCLLDEDTASDGDQFAWVFREAGLGPLIGKRSWGGVVGIYGRGSLIDGGSVSVPEAGSSDKSGQWVIEGLGVEPDLEVDNDPESILAGRDPQLEKAIEVLLEAIAEDPRPLPARPADPVKTP